MPVYTNDITSAEKEIVIVSPQISKRRSMQMLKTLQIALSNNVKVIITRPFDEYQNMDNTTLVEISKIMNDNGISLVNKSNIHQKFAVVVKKIIWYGSINLMSYGNSEESIMRLESFNVANELIKSIEKVMT